MRQDKVIVVGYVYASDQNGLVLDTEGICNCLGCGAHGGVEPKIMVVDESD